MLLLQLLKCFKLLRPLLFRNDVAVVNCRLLRNIEEGNRINNLVVIVSTQLDYLRKVNDAINRM